MHCKNLDEMSLYKLKECVDEELAELIKLTDYAGDKSKREMLSEAYIALSEVEEKWKMMMEKDKKHFMS